MSAICTGTQLKTNKMKRQTAVDWLEEQLKEIHEKNNLIIEDLIWDTAKKKEQLQATDAWWDGFRTTNKTK